MDSVQRSLKTVGKQMTKVGKQMSIGVTAPIVALGAASVKTFADFEQALAKVQAVSGATAAQMEALRKNAEDLGGSTRFAASQVAELQLNYSKLGLSPEQILEATEATLALAQAADEDLAEAATVAASTVSGFNMSVSETTRVTDVMAASFSSSALDLRKFQTAMAVLGPVANSVGRSLEESTGMLSVLVDAGLDASTAGTGLRNIFLDLASKGMTLEEALEAIATSSNQSKTAMDLFGKRGATVATVLANNIDRARDLTKAYENSAGAAKDMAGIMDNTLQGSFFALQSAVESAAIAIGDVLAPHIRRIATFSANLISKFKDLSHQTRTTIVVIGALAAAIGPLLLSLGFLATNVIPGLITSFGYLRAAMLAMPGAALVAGLTAIATALAIFTRRTSEATAVSRALGDVRKQAATIVSEERAQLDSLLKVAQDETRNKEDREKAIKRLNAISPEYLENLELETINQKETTTAVESYIAALDKKALAQAAMTKKSELYAKRIEKEMEELSAVPGFLSSDGIWAALGVESRTFRGLDDLNNYLEENIKKGAMSAEAADAMRAAYQPLIDSRQKDLDLIDAQISALDKYIDVSSKATAAQIESADVIVNPAGGRAQVRQVTDPSFTGEGLAISSPLDYLEKKLPDQAEMILGTLKEFDKNIVDVSAGLNNALQSAAVNAAQFIGDFVSNLMSGQASASDAFKGLLMIVASFMENLGQAMIAAGVASEAFKNLFASGIGAIVAGTALIALSKVVANILKGGPEGNSSGSQRRMPALAAGGIAYGPTTALIGEYAGARANPEVIAPLDKLKSMIADSSSGGTVQQVEVKGVIKGTDIHLQNKRTGSYLKRRS